MSQELYRKYSGNEKQDSFPTFQTGNSIAHISNSGHSSDRNFGQLNSINNDYFSPGFQMRPSSNPLVRKTGLFQYKVYKQATPAHKVGDEWNKIIYPVAQRKGQNITSEGPYSDTASYMQSWDEKRGKRSREYDQYGTSKRKRVEHSDKNYPKKVKRPTYKSIHSNLSHSARHSRLLEQMKDYIAIKFGRDNLLRKYDIDLGDNIDILDALFFSWDEIQKNYFNFDSEEFPKTQRKNPENLENYSEYVILTEQLKLLDERIETMKKLEELFDESEKVNEEKVTNMSQGAFEKVDEDPSESQNISSQQSILSQEVSQLEQEENVQIVNSTKNLFNLTTRLKEVNQLSKILGEVLQGELDSFNYERFQAEQLNKATIQSLLPQPNDSASSKALTNFLDKSMKTDISEMYSDQDTETETQTEIVSKHNKNKQPNQSSENNQSSEGEDQFFKSKSQKGKTNKKQKKSRSSIASNQEADVLNQNPQEALEDFIS